MNLIDVSKGDSLCHVISTYEVQIKAGIGGVKKRVGSRPINLNDFVLNKMIVKAKVTHQKFILQHFLILPITKLHRWIFIPTDDMT